jgi:hypothetical protein
MNSGRKVILAILFFLAGVTVATTYRRTAVGDYGRLFDAQRPVVQQPVVTRTVSVVTEAPAPAASADTMLDAPVAAAAPEPAKVALASDDSGTVVITRANGERPRLLSGGIFKPQQ